MTKPLDYASANDRPKRAVWPWIVVSASLLAGMLLTAILMNTPRRSYGPNYRAMCGSNLMQIGMAILLYSNENNGAPPPDFATALATQELVPGVFVCPISSDTKIASTQPADLAKLEAGGHCSYAYVRGYASVSNLTAYDVIAFEWPGHHPGGGNVLFGDGHAEFLTDKELAEIVRQFNATTRPIRLPGSTSTP